MPWRLLACSGLFVALDFATGPTYAVSVLFVLPVISAAWHQGRGFACALAVGLSLLRFVCHWSWGFPLDLNPALINNLLRVLTLLLVAFLTSHLASQLRAIRKRRMQLEERLPICPVCGLACHADGQWLPLDDSSELCRSTAAKSFCPDCERKHYDMQRG